MSENLKPCPNPWCFSTTAPLPMGLGYEKGWRVACACGIQTFRAETCDDAIVAWNRRAPPMEGWKPDREAVAREVDPEAWAEVDRWYVHGERVHINRAIVGPSLHKADAILALKPEGSAA